MQETEAKFYVLDLKSIEARLHELEARLIQPRVLETNVRFDLPGKRLRSEGRVLRLRRDIGVRLTYKGPSANEHGVLSRTEIEFTVGDFDRARAFLEALGYQELITYEKYRTTYILEASGASSLVGVSEVSVMLDELPYGNFVEIEGETAESIRSIAHELKLKWDSAIATGYHALFERLCAQRPELDPAQLTFEALNGMKISAEELSVHAADG